MAVTYGFFDSRNGDRKYNADQMSEYFRGIVSGGVFQHLDGGLQVTAGTGLSVNVAAGRAIVQNRWIQNSASLPLSISAASETYGRKDAVVLRLDSSARTVSITVKTGTPAASPAAPSMTRSGGVYEMALAYVNVAAGATSVTVTDKRSDSAVCGWAAVAQATSGEVDQMLNDMKTGFDGDIYDSPVEMVQGEDEKLDDKITDLEGGLKFRHLNQFNKDDVTRNSYLGRSVGVSSCFDPPISGGTGFVANQIYRVKLNDVIYCTHPAVIIYVYDSNGLFIERYTDESVYNKTITAPNAYYMRWQYGTEANINQIMISINNPLPGEYTPYSEVSITTVETTDLNERVLALEHKSDTTYVLISFDDQTQMYADRFPVMQEYGFPFTFAINNNFEIDDGFSSETAKNAFFAMLNYGCDFAQYSVSQTATPPTSTSTVQEWEDALRPLYEKLNSKGLYPSTYFARQNVLYDNAITALKNIGFSIARSGMYSPENNYRWIESFDDNRFNTPVYIVNSDTLSNCKAYLDDCIENGWSIAFMTHRLTGADENNCDITTFRSLMDYIKDYVDEGKCKVVTYQQFLNEKTNKGETIDNTRKSKTLNWVHGQLLQND